MGVKMTYCDVCGDLFAKDTVDDDICDNCASDYEMEEY